MSLQNRNKSNNSELSESSLKAKQAFGTRRVHFDPVVRVAMLPTEERVDARRARKGQWKPGPFHDELWDGEILDFREAELTTEEFKRLMRNYNPRGTRGSIPRRIRSIFIIAADKVKQPRSGAIVGLDTVTARARLSEDFDAEDEEPIADLPDSSSNIQEEIPPPAEAAQVVTVSSSDSLPGSRTQSIRVSYHDFERGRPSPPASPMTSLPSKNRVKFEYSVAATTKPGNGSSRVMSVAAMGRTHSMSTILDPIALREGENEDWKLPRKRAGLPSSSSRNVLLWVMVLLFINRYLVQVTFKRIMYTCILIATIMAIFIGHGAFVKHVGGGSKG